MMVGSMIEAKNRRAILSSVDPQTFVRFAEFIYTGDYTVAALKVLDNSSKGDEAGDMEQSSAIDRPASPVIAAFVPEPLDGWVLREKSVTQADSWAFSTTPRKGQKKTSHSLPFFGNLSDQPGSDSVVWLELGKRFLSACDESTEQIQQKWRKPLPYRNTNPRQEMDEFFLAHARVYVFGDTYGIKELSLLAIHKVRQILSTLRLFPQSIIDLVALIRYSYNNTPDNDALRNVLAEYSACMAKHLMENQNFTTLTKENGSFSTDLLTKIVGQVT